MGGEGASLHPPLSDHHDHLHHPAHVGHDLPVFLCVFFYREEDGGGGGGGGGGIVRVWKVMRQAGWFVYLGDGVFVLVSKGVRGEKGTKGK